MGDAPEAGEDILLTESKIVQGTVDGIPFVVASVVISGQNLPLFPLKPKAISLSVGVILFLWTYHTLCIAQPHKHPTLSGTTPQHPVFVSAAH